MDKGSKFSVPVKPRDRAQGSTEIKVLLYPSGVGVPGGGKPFLVAGISEGPPGIKVLLHPGRVLGVGVSVRR